MTELLGRVAWLAESGCGDDDANCRNYGRDHRQHHHAEVHSQLMNDLCLEFGELGREPEIEAVAKRTQVGLGRNLSPMNGRQRRHQPHDQAVALISGHSA